MGGGLLEGTKLFWEVIKDGAKLTVAPPRVHAIPEGMTPAQLGSTWERAEVSEQFHEVSWIFGSDLARFQIDIRWQYDGRHIADFTVDATGTVDVCSNVDVSAETDTASIDSSGEYYELPYTVHVTFKNILGGTRRVKYQGVVYGNGGGKSGGWS
jgi:hypothetical protein